MARSSSSPQPTLLERNDVDDAGDGATLGGVNPLDGEAGIAGDPQSTQATAASPTTTDPNETPVGDTAEPLDLARIERDLDGVEAALRRLDDGTYWTDEVSGAPLPDDLLEADPVARRVEG